MTWQSEFYKKFESSLGNKDGVEFIRFTQGVGYSIVGNYSNSYKRLMGVGKYSTYKPMYKLAVKEANSSKEYLPLYISAGLTLVEEEDGQKRYLLSYGKIKGIAPIDFSSKDDFYVQKKTGELFEKTGQEYKKTSYLKLIERMQRTHLSKLTDLKAMYLRTRILILRKLPSFTLTSLAFLSGIMTWFIEGKRFQFNVIEESLRDEFDTRRTVEATSEPKEQIDFFGYKVSIWTLFSFSLLVLTLAVLAQYYTLPFYEIPFGSPGPMLVIAIAIVSIVTYDKIIPITLKWIVKKFQVWAFNLKYKGIKLSI